MKITPKIRIDTIGGKRSKSKNKKKDYKIMLKALLSGSVGYYNGFNFINIKED